MEDLPKVTLSAEEAKTYAMIMKAIRVLPKSDPRFALVVGVTWWLLHRRRRLEQQRIRRRKFYRRWRRLLFLRQQMQQQKAEAEAEDRDVEEEEDETTNLFPPEDFENSFNLTDHFLLNKKNNPTFDEPDDHDVPSPPPADDSIVQLQSMMNKSLDGGLMGLGLDKVGTGTKQLFISSKGNIYQKNENL